MVECCCRFGRRGPAMARQASSSLNPLGLQTRATHGRTGCPPEARIGSLSISCSARSVLACVGPGVGGEVDRTEAEWANQQQVCMCSESTSLPATQTNVQRSYSTTAVHLIENICGCFVWAHGPPQICIIGEVQRERPHIQWRGTDSGRQAPGAAVAKSPKPCVLQPLPPWPRPKPLRGTPGPALWGLWACGPVSWALLGTHC